MKWWLILCLPLIFAACAPGDNVVFLLMSNHNGKVLSSVDDHGNSFPGAAGVAYRSSILRNSFGDNGVALVGIGNMLHGSPEAQLTNGEAVIEFAEKLGFIGFVPGPRDFDYPLRTFLNLTEFACSHSAPLLAVNLAVSKTHGKLPGCIFPGRVLHMGSHRVMFTGIVPNSDSLPHDYKNYIEVLSPIDSLSRYLRILSSTGMRVSAVAVGVYLQSGETDSPVVKEILDSGLVDMLFVSGEDAAEAVERKEGGVTVVTVPSRPSRALAYNMLADQGTAYNLTPDEADPAKYIEEMAAGLNELQGRMASLARHEIGNTFQPIPAPKPGLNPSSPAANVITDALLDEAARIHPVDAVLIPDMYVQFGFPEGTITSLDLQRACPSNPRMEARTMPGKILIRVLTKMAKYSSREHSQLLPRLSRGCSVSLQAGEDGLEAIDASVKILGAPINPEATYTILIPEDLAIVHTDDVEVGASLNLPAVKLLDARFGTLREMVRRSLAASGTLRPQNEQRLIVESWERSE